jgi:hypothetical protein
LDGSRRPATPLWEQTRPLRPDQRELPENGNCGLSPIARMSGATVNRLTL